MQTNRQTPPAVRFYYQSTIPQRESGKLPEAVKSCFLRHSASQQEVEKYDIQNIIVRSTFTGTLCKLCQTRYKLEQIGCFGECGHEFCKRCLHNYIIYKISVMEEVTCPQEECRQTLDTHSFCYLDLPQEYRQRYERFLLWKQTIANPNLRLCPAEHCKGVINTQDSFTCNTCRREYCGECMLAKHRGSCDSNFQRTFKGWQRCPRCKIFIEKNNGCNHMACLCGHHFCYVCLANWKGKHYHCGENLPRWQQILRAIAMIILTPLFFVLAVGLLLLAVALSVVLGALIGPYLVARATCSSDCCQLWFVIMIVALPVVIVVFAIVGAIRTFQEGFIYICHLLLRHFVTICELLCPQQADEEYLQPVEQLI